MIPTTDLAIPFFSYKSQASAYPEIECRVVGDPVTRRACLCRPEITDGAVRLNRRHNAGHHEDRASQYRLQHAPFPRPRKIERERVVIQRGTALDMLKTQTENTQKNHQSNRQKPEITNKEHQ